MAISLIKNSWQIYMGIMVETTIKKNQRWFHIFVPELLPIKVGNVSSEDGSYKISIPNQKTGKTEELNVSTTSTIYADYFGITAGFDVPTMSRGMQVLVMNRLSTDKWYWLPLERDDSLKTFEHFRVSCNDVSVTNKSDSDPDDVEAKDKGVTDDNSYFFEIDTKYRKHILLSTSASDGEEWRYFFKIDCEQHTVELWDNCVDGSQPNNTIKLESRPDPQTLGRITLQNASGNSIIMSGKDTMVNIPRNLVVNVGGATTMQFVGDVAETFLSNFNKIIKKNEVRETGMNATKVVSLNNMLTVGVNNTTVTGALSSETQQEKVIVTKTITSLSTSNLKLLVAASSTFMLNALSVAGNTISIKAEQAWSLTTKWWTETARAVGGTVVSLIRGGHH